MNELAEKAKDRVISGEHNLKLSEDDRNIRYDICKSCEHFYHPTTTCKKCGCFMVIKTYLSFSECPVGKWKSIKIVKI